MPDNIREGDPDRPRKKKAAPPPDEDEDDRPRKKKKRAAEEDEDESGDDLGSSALSAVLPVGGSVFGLLALWLSVLSGLMGLAGMILFWKSPISALLPSLWPVALLCGILALFTHKHKASYGSITGNLRAIIGILISLGVMLMQGFLVFVWLSPRM